MFSYTWNLTSDSEDRKRVKSTKEEKTKGISVKWINPRFKKGAQRPADLADLEFGEQDYTELFRKETYLVHEQIGTRQNYQHVELVTIDTVAGPNLIDVGRLTPEF